jgi:ribonuclease D
LGVASKLLATVSDLEEIAASDAADVAAMKGWRREAFGGKALRLKRGEIGLVMKGKRVRVFDVAADAIIDDEPEMDGDDS